MRKLSIVVLTLALMLATIAVAGDMETLIAGVQKHYSKAKDLTLDFEQATVVKTMGGQVQKASGKLYFKQPNKFRMIYTAPSPKEIISDGSTLVLYYAEEKRAYLTKTAGQFDISTPVSILSGKIDVSTTFTPELLADQDGRGRVKLTPKKPAGYTYLIMHVNRQTFAVEILESADAYGNITTLKLLNQRFNTGVPESRFVFTPQPGVEIQDSPMMDLN